MKLRHDHAFGTVDDESAVVGHQRDFAEENFFFFDVADREDFSFRILVVNRQPNFYLERNAVAHAAFLTLLLIVLVLQTDWLAAVFAELRAYLIKRAALVAKSFACRQRVDLDGRTAALTICAQVVKTFQPSALTLPVADLIFDEIERGGAAKI